MTSWFRRQNQPSAPQPQEDPDAPDALRRRLWEIVQFVNKSSGRMPVEAVVIARQITDTIREVIDTSDERALDAYAVVQVNSIVGDYLPTTLRTYLNLDPGITDEIGPSGRAPRAALREQLESLRAAAQEMLHATRAHDVDLLFSQGSFLKTKFTRSDLDL